MGTTCVQAPSSSIDGVMYNLANVKLAMAGDRKHEVINMLSQLLHEAVEVGGGGRGIGGSPPPPPRMFPNLQVEPKIRTVCWQFNPLCSPCRLLVNLPDCQIT